MSEELVTCKLQVSGLGLLCGGHQPCCVQLLPHTLLHTTQMGQNNLNHINHIYKSFLRTWCFEHNYDRWACSSEHASRRLCPDGAQSHASSSHHHTHEVASASCQSLTCALAHSHARSLACVLTHSHARSHSLTSCFTPLRNFLCNQKHHSPLTQPPITITTHSTSSRNQTCPLSCEHKLHTHCQVV